jgi:hypothetical protein
MTNVWTPATNPLHRLVCMIDALSEMWQLQDDGVTGWGVDAWRSQIYNANLSITATLASIRPSPDESDLWGDGLRDSVRRAVSIMYDLVDRMMGKRCFDELPPSPDQVIPLTTLDILLSVRGDIIEAMALWGQCLAVDIQSRCLIVGTPRLTADLLASWASELVSTDVAATETEAIGLPADRKKMNAEEINVAVRDYLLQHKDNHNDITRDSIANAVGCSAGAVSNSNAWKAFRDRRDRSKRPSSRTVPLTDDMIVNISDDITTDIEDVDIRSEELRILIAEQNKDRSDDDASYKKYAKKKRRD